MLGYLWSHRESPRLFSKRWMVVWAKRALTAPVLAALWRRRLWLRLRGAQIGDLAIIERCSLQGPVNRLSVGRMSFIGAGSTMALHEHIVIGECVAINSGVTILTASHDVGDPGWSMVRRSVVIADHAWIATGAMLLPGVRIGRGAVVGAGAVVRKDVPDHAIVTGNPSTPAGAQRCREFDYSPVAFAAPIEAWLGKPGRRPAR